MWGEHFAAVLVAVCCKAPRKFKNQQSSTRLVLCEDLGAQGVNCAGHLVRSKYESVRAHQLCVWITIAVRIAPKSCDNEFIAMKESLVVPIPYSRLEPMDVHSSFI